MNENTLNTLLPLLYDLLFIIGFALFYVSLMIGLLMIVQPVLIIRLNKKANKVGKGKSFRSSTKFLEEKSNIDPLFYKHHRMVGVIIILMSSYILYYFSMVYDETAITGLLTGTENAFLIDILINTLRVFMLVCSVFILMIGFVISIRPSLIRKVEVIANQWISTRQGAKALSVERNQVNNIFYRYPRFTGLIIVTLSLYASIMLFLFYTQ